MLRVNNRMYNGVPGISASEMRLSHSPATESEPLPTHCVIDAGNSRIELAKIAGITPAIFTFSGRWLCCAA